MNLKKPIYELRIFSVKYDDVIQYIIGMYNIRDYIYNTCRVVPLFRSGRSVKTSIFWESIYRYVYV